MSKIKNMIKTFIPKPIRQISKAMYRNGCNFLLDGLDALSGQRDELTPPRRKRFFIGSSDFNQTGQEFLQYFIEICELKPNEKVLDVGCGIGRMALPLTKYLDGTGRYEGFDIVADEINWCTEKITARYPNFHFKLFDVYNKLYNPNGKYQAAEHKFPYPDEYFDFVFLTSVFTHMLPQDLENYFSECARVLKRTGRCLMTYFLLNAESMNFVDAKLSADDFKYSFDGYRIADRGLPEASIAYDENLVRRLYQQHHLIIQEPIRYGSWCGRKNFLSFQDIIISIKN
jgi:SAM-dependent methyltransferase